LKRTVIEPEIRVFCAPRLRGVEREWRRLHEADVVAGALVDAVEVCESSGQEFEVDVEVLE
jgi:hypothetical protein